MLRCRQVFSTRIAKSIQVHFVEDHVGIVATSSARNTVELERARRTFVHRISRTPIDHRAGEVRFDSRRRETFRRPVQNSRRASMFDG